jgi:hypothetical protein
MVTGDLSKALHHVVRVSVLTLRFNYFLDLDPRQIIINTSFDNLARLLKVI